jgi:hypothetical protein
VDASAERIFANLTAFQDWLGGASAATGCGAGRRHIDDFWRAIGFLGRSTSTRTQLAHVRA